MFKRLLLISLILVSSCKKEESSYNPYLSGKGESKKVSGLYTFENKKFNLDELPQQLNFAKYRAEEKRYMELLHSIRELYVRKSLMKDRGMSDFDSKGGVATLSQIFKNDFQEKDVKKYFEENRKQFPKIDPKKDKSWLGKVRYIQMVDHITKNYMRKLREITDKKELLFHFLPPNIKETGINFDKYPRIGSKDSKLELIAVTNYFCEECRRVNGEVSKIFKNYGEQLSYIHVGHVFNLTDVSMDSIIAGNCIYKLSPKKFWEFQKLMYEKDEIKDVKIFDNKKMRLLLDGIISKISIDKKNFYKCMSDKENRYKASDSITFFRNLDIKEIPTYFLNGRKISYLEMNSLVSAFEEMKKRIENAQ